VLQEKICFELGGLTLQEPMALITNWLISVFCAFAYFKLKDSTKEDVKLWRQFFLFFGISTFFGGTGHLFFQYFDKPGKIPNWIFGFIAGYFVSKAMLFNLKSLKLKKNLEIFVIAKMIILFLLSVYTLKFVFVAVDSMITFILFCGFIAYHLSKNGFPEYKNLYLGVLICLPTVFIFFLKLNVHRWLNKDDLSHFLMLGCLVYFYIGVSKRNSKKSPLID